MNYFFSVGRKMSSPIVDSLKYMDTKEDFDWQ